MLQAEAPTELVWRAQAKQVQFLRAQEYAVLYGGAAGGGKSDALLIFLIKLCSELERAKTLFLMKTYKDLSEPGAAVDRAQELLTGLAAWNNSDMLWTFPNKSKLQFGHLQHENDIYNYEQAQLDALGIDSLTSLSKRSFLYMNSRVRATVQGSKPKVRAGTNPGNIGHQWVRDMFIDAAPWNTRFMLRDPDSGEEIGDARFIPAKLDDNPAMVERDPDYGRRLNLLPDDLRRAYRDGDWDIFAGQFFPEWRRSLHVCEPFAIDASWPRWRSVDWGYGAPYCCLWLTRDPKTRRKYVYREVYEPGVIDSEQAKRIVALTGKDYIRYTVADPSMWNRQPNGTSIAQVYLNNGVAMAPANNDRQAGWQRVHEELRGHEDQPSLQVFSTCTNLIRTLPAMIHDKVDVEDLDSSQEDHAVDTLRMALMGARNVDAASYGFRDFRVSA